jgi:hypothetical protein
MTKGILYALPRTALRREKHEYARALELFQSTGDYMGDPVLVAYVVTYCFDRKISFQWDERLIGTDEGVSRVRRT